MLVSKVRDDGVFDGFVEFPDGTTKIPRGHSFSLPPEIPEGHYATMMGGWVVVEGEKPVWPVPPTEEEKIQKLYKEVVDSAQLMLDDFARTRGYDGILSACSYATSTVEKFRTESQYCVEARDATWATLYQIMKDVRDGVRPLPEGWAQIQAELPVLQWPDEVGV